MHTALHWHGNTFSWTKVILSVQEIFLWVQFLKRWITVSLCNAHSAKIIQFQFVFLVQEYIYIYIYIHRITVIINNNKKDNNNNKNVTSSTGLIRRNFLCKSQEHFQLVFLKSIVQKDRGWLFDLLVVV